ncbi:MAG TPA: sigma-70 family RNA polymerase sigma factor [Actinomycetota bacterium]|nr:sigma-70 family RNA polymerase sigma factor [Actinomycetota bacterium]
MATEQISGGSPTNQSDILLVAGLARHDEASLKMLMDTCGRFVYGKALQIVREPHLAEEIAQDTLLTLWWNSERFDITKGTLKAFLMGVARYKAIDVVRHQEVIRAKDALLARTESFFHTPAADGQVVDSMLMKDAISTLPLAKREVMFLAYYKGLTYREVALQLDIPEATVRTRARDSLIRLRSVLALPKAG